MAVDANIRDQAYQFFIQEAPELLQILEMGLLSLKEDQSTPRIHELMRSAHSIKGGAASVDLPVIQKLAHRLEDVFRALYRQTIVIDSAVEEALLQAYDCLRGPLQTQIQTGRHDGEAALNRAEPIFAQLEALFGDDLRADLELPTSAELGIDIVQAIFTGDVEAGLMRLETVLAAPENHEVAGEIRAQAEVFAGIGELVNLPGFTEIARVTIAALQSRPEQAWAIGQLATANFRVAQTTVLAGDRTQGGEPSFDLLSLVASTSVTDEVADLEALWQQPDADVLAIFNLEDRLEEQPDQGLTAQFGTDALPPLEMTDDLDAIFGGVEDFEIFEGFGGLESALPDLTVPSVSAATNQTNSDALVSEVASQTDSDQFPIELPLKKDPNLSISEPETSPHLGTSVRVDLQRLERLNNLVGELVTQENGMMLQSQNLQGTLNQMLQRFSHFERVTKELQDWTDRSQNLQVRLTEDSTRPMYSSSAPLTLTSSLADFDTLQMDSYSSLHLLVQETIEEIAQFGESMRDLVLLTQQSQQVLRKKQQTLKQVRDDLLWARMLPLGDLLQRFPRMVRNLASQYHKQVRLKLTGSSTLVDKLILEKLYDPLVHLVRNAFDHGIELPSVRQAVGKPIEATIEIRAYHRGNQTYIEVRDDGRGIDLEAVRQKVIAQNLLPAAEALALSPEGLYAYLFTPAFTTTKQVSELSGRGMGLDTVQAQVNALKGLVMVASEPGQGTTFTLRLPLTLTIAKLLVFGINGRFMALPVDMLQAIVAASESQIQTIQGRQFYRQNQEELIPLFPSSELTYLYPLPQPVNEKLQGMSLPQAGKIPLLLIQTSEQTIALEVEQILNEQELVIKPFGAAITPPPYLYGCTILGDGTLVPVMDGPALVNYWLKPELFHTGQATLSAAQPALPEQLPAQQRQSATILVTDDSLTTRQTLALTLTKAGYRVVQAKDGREALEQLQRHPDIQVVFCDIEMPQMNGFEFLSHCRQTRAKSELPVVMLTSRNGEKHRQLAQLMGANSYLTKPYLEHELLKTLDVALRTKVETKGDIGAGGGRGAHPRTPS